MKINRKSQLGLQISENHDMQLQIISEQVNRLKARSGLLTEKEINFGVQNTTELVLEDGKYYNQNYLLRNSAIEMVKKIPVDTPKFNITFLKNLPFKKATFLLGDGLAMKYYKTADNVYAVFYRSEMTELGMALVWTFLRIDLINGDIIVPNRESAYDSLDDAKVGFSKMDNPYKDAHFKLFIQLLLFVELSELSIELLAPNKKTGTKKSGKYLNDSSSNVSIVDSKWNVVSVRNESFLVSGHWRMQPYGTNSEQRKMIWIDTFEKNGYIRKKNRVENSNLKSV